MEEDPRKNSQEEAPKTPDHADVPARGMSDDLVDGKTVDIPEKSKKAPENSAE